MEFPFILCAASSQRNSAQGHLLCKQRRWYGRAGLQPDALFHITPSLGSHHSEGDLNIRLMSQNNGIQRAKIYYLERPFTPLPGVDNSQSKEVPLMKSLRDCLQICTINMTFRCKYKSAQGNI